MVSGCSQKDLEPENNSEDLEREYNDMHGIRTILVQNKLRKNQNQIIR